MQNSGNVLFYLPLFKSSESWVIKRWKIGVKNESGKQAEVNVMILINLILFVEIED